MLNWIFIITYIIKDKFVLQFVYVDLEFPNRRQVQATPNCRQLEQYVFIEQ